MGEVVDIRSKVEKDKRLEELRSSLRLWNCAMAEDYTLGELAQVVEEHAAGLRKLADGDIA